MADKQRSTPVNAERASGGQPASPAHLVPADMETWVLIRAYRLAYQLQALNPNLMLARELANFLYRAQRELERREEWRADYLRETF
jgi:hypothetical protein